jgi:5'-phosphate synthase pdxT subunit
VRVRRNHFGRQIESFVSDLTLPFLPGGGVPAFSAVFIRAPIVEEVLNVTAGRPEVEILARLPPRGDASGTGEGDIVAVRQGNIFGTSFHPELTGDDRVHAWWLGEVLRQL